VCFVRASEGIASHEFQLCGCFILTLRLLLVGNFLCIAQRYITLLRVVPGADIVKGFVQTDFDINVSVVLSTLEMSV
jgi:hypothetical protein